MPVKNIWVFGGTGFIGKALLQNLSTKKGYRLNVVVHKNVPYRLLEPYNTFCSSLEDFDFDWFGRYPPHYIFHLARLGGSNNFTRYLASQKGAHANQRLIDYLSEQAQKPVITYVSGSLMYGNRVDGQSATELSPLNPVSYAKHYIYAERPWLKAQQNNILDIRFARPGWIIGPESWFNYFYWLPYCLTGKVPLYGTGDQLMSLVHIKDCAGQIANLAFHASSCQNLNVFTGLPITQAEFSHMLAHILHADVQTMDAAILTSKYGKTICEALLSNIPISTVHENIHDKYSDAFPEPEDMLRDVLSFLKNK